MRFWATTNPRRLYWCILGAEDRSSGSAQFTGKKVAADLLVLTEWVDALIERSLAKRPSTDKLDNSKARYVLLYELANQTSDKIRMRTELLSSLLAGRDTTASLLSDAWWSISKDPQVWNRLRKEVDALESPLGERRPIFEELKDMRYLRAVLNESLRLHAVVPANSRQAVTDTTIPLGGGTDGKSPVFVPKGTIVSYGVDAMHRRKDLFGEDAEEFKPERWLDEGEKKGLRVGWEYLPFNGGPRICIGRESLRGGLGSINHRLQGSRTICPHRSRIYNRSANARV